MLLIFCCNKVRFMLLTKLVMILLLSLAVVTSPQAGLMSQQLASAP